MDNLARKPSSGVHSFVAPKLHVAENHEVLGTFKQRFVALTADSFFIGIIFGVINAAIHMNHHSQAKPSALLYYLLHYLYFILLEYNDGQTLGKKIMKIKVVSTKNIDPDLELRQVIGRETIGRFISTITLCIGYTSSRKRSDRKTFHDRMFNTKVISIKI